MAVHDGAPFSAQAEARAQLPVHPLYTQFEPTRQNRLLGKVAARDERTAPTGARRIMGSLLQRWGTTWTVCVGAGSCTGIKVSKNELPD